MCCSYGRPRRSTRPRLSAWREIQTFSLMVRKSSCRLQTTATDSRWVVRKAGFSMKLKLNCTMIRFYPLVLCVFITGAWWQNRIGAVPVAGAALQNPVYMFVQESICSGSGTRERKCAGKKHKINWNPLEESSYIISSLSSSKNTKLKW